MDRWTLGHVPVDPVTMDGAIEAIMALVRSGGGTVFTPNVDHVVLAERNEAFRRAYERASLSLIDGMPVLWASRLLRRPAPEKVSGSDLLLPLLERAAKEQLRVFVLGGAPGVAEAALRKVKGLTVAGIDASALSEQDDLTTVAERIRESRADLVVVALGAPKQEIVCDRLAVRTRPAVFIAVGAAIDFLAGTQSRAPRWMSRVGLEWLYRLVRNPRRLYSRYLVRDPKFLAIVAREMSRSAA